MKNIQGYKAFAVFFFILGLLSITILAAMVHWFVLLAWLGLMFLALGGAALDCARAEEQKEEENE